MPAQRSSLTCFTNALAPPAIARPPRGDSSSALIPRDWSAAWRFLQFVVEIKISHSLCWLTLVGLLLCLHRLPKHWCAHLAVTTRRATTTRRAAPPTPTVTPTMTRQDEAPPSSSDAAGRGDGTGAGAAPSTCNGGGVKGGWQPAAGVSVVALSLNNTFVPVTPQPAYEMTAMDEASNLQSVNITR